MRINLSTHKQCLSCHGLSLVQMMYSSIVTAVHLRQLHRTSTLVYFLTLSSVGATTRVDHVLRKVSRKIFALRTAGSQLTLKSRRQYYVSVIQPDLEYGSTLRSVKACLEISAIRNVWAAASRAIVQWKNGACLVEDSDGSIRVSGKPAFPPPVWTQSAMLVRMREAANNCCCLLSFFLLFSVVVVGFF